MASSKATPRKGFKIPKTLGECADKLHALAGEKKIAQSVVDKIDAEEKIIEAHLLEELPKQKQEGVVGHAAKANIKKEDIPTLKDPDKFYAFVLKTKDFSLLQRRLARNAIRELWDQGKKVPGVDTFIHKYINVTKK